MRTLRRFHTVALGLSLAGSAIATASLLDLLTPLTSSAAVADPNETALGSAGRTVEPDTPLTMTGATDAERALTEWAIGRFASAGLALPSITVDFRDDDGCGGAAGLYRHAAATVTVCNRGSHHNPPRQVLLHELAHAWSLHTMDDEDIAAFLAHQGLRDWTGSDLGYWGDGAERVAEYVAWGLQDSTDEDRSIWTYGKACDDLADAFHLVTGSEPLNDSPGHCEAA